MIDAEKETEFYPQYLSEYRSYVARLQAELGNSDAMSYAVGGGDFEATGEAEAHLLARFGLTAGHTIVDVGCGSGRLATALSRQYGNAISYLGTDIVEDLLIHARQISHVSYVFQLNTDLTIPAADASCDFVVFFSVLTHLLHEQSYLYLRDAKRALKPGGKIVATFLEAKHHWPIFERVVAIYGRVKEPLVMFTERPTLEAWAYHLGLRIIQFVPTDAPGQSTVMFTH
jgi:ubiquinone/menaquinone biosynthesis C-methylase UbiE